MLFASLALFALVQEGSALTEAALVLDINTTLGFGGIQSSRPRPRGFTGFGDSVLFVADGQGLDRGLWRLPHGGLAVPLSTPASSRAEAPVVLSNGRTVYATKLLGSDRLLASTDGTAAGTGVLEDPASGRPIAANNGPTAVGARAWFTEPSTGFSLRVASSDGNQDGTRVEFVVPSGFGQSQEAFFHPVGGGVFLSAIQNSEPSLFFSAGTGAPPVDQGPVEDPQLGPGLIEQAIAFKGELWFVAEGPTGGDREPWRSDGSLAGTGLFLDLEPGPDSSSPRWLCADDSRLFFSATRSSDGSAKEGVWVTDGAADSATQLTDASTNLNVVSGTLMDDGRLLFGSNSPALGELWLSDGTPAGTQPFTSVSDLIVGGMVAVGPQVYFTTTASNNELDLWVTDGTVAGTQDLGNAMSSNGLGEPVLGASGSSLYFARSSAEVGEEVWSSSGTVATTVLAANVSPEALSDGSSPEQWLRLGGRGVFTATTFDPVGFEEDREVWITDGTTAGTQQIADLIHGNMGSQPQLVGELGARVLFVATTLETGR